MGFFSGICSFVGSICSSIGGAIGSIGKVVSGALSILTGPVASIVMGAVMGVGKLLGITTEKEKPEELGMKAAKSDKRLEDFNSYKEYKNYLNSIELTREDMKKMEENKSAYAHIGTAVCLQGINDFYDMPISIETFIALAQIGLKNGNSIKTLLDEYKKKNIKPNIDKVVSGKNITPMESDKILGVLNEVLEKMNDGSKLEERLNNMMAKKSN